MCYINPVEHIHQSLVYTTLPKTAASAFDRRENTPLGSEILWGFFFCAVFFVKVIYDTPWMVGIFLPGLP